MTLLLLQGCSGNEAPGRTGAGPLPLLESQSVTATVKRAALRLVRLETEHEGFLVTPEHPFAVPGSGWLSAGRLVPGDWVVSERFGAVRLLSARSEPATRPVEVFNLSVAASHSYFVGTDRVLVHNTKCKDKPSESKEATIERLTREREEVMREIKALAKTTPTSPRITELRNQRKKLQRQIDDLRRVQRKEQGVRAASRDERDRRRHELEYEVALKALEDTKKELADLEGRPPGSEAERVAWEARRAELEKQIPAHELVVDRTNRILGLLGELARLEKEVPVTAGDRLAHAERSRALRAELARERTRARGLRYVRGRRADPERRAESDHYDRALLHRLLRLPVHLSDTKRPRDPLELLEDELAGRLQETPSESRDVRIHHLTEQIETMKRLVEARRQRRRLLQRRAHAQRAREKLSAKGADTTKPDERLEQVRRELYAVRIEVAQLRVRERLLVQLDETPWAHASGSVDEVRLREVERQLAEGIAEGLENEQRLADIERVLDGLEPTRADLREPALGEADDTDAILSERGEPMPQRPSAERGAGFESNYERLQQELREERVAVEAAESALANQHAYIQTTQAASSRGPSWQERLRAIQEEQAQLRAQWRAGLQARLDSARSQLRLLRSIDRFHDEAMDADLVRQVALLERELQNSG